MSYENFDEFLQEEQITYQDFIEELSQTKDSEIVEAINQLKEGGIETIDGYVIINPNEEFSKSYLAEENGKYTFKVKEILTNKTYESSVEISNIDKSKLLYSVKFNIGEVILVDKKQNSTNFEEAYIIYNGEKIDVTDCIGNKKDYPYLDILLIALKLKELGKLENIDELSGTKQTLQIVKDGVSYFGYGLVAWPL